jgi:hypothetical protein
MQRNDRPSRPVNRGDFHLDGFVKLRILAGVVGRTSAPGRATSGRLGTVAAMPGT